MVQQIPPTGLSNNRPFRNKIVNGDFNIFQRATSATTAGHNTYTTADRWKTQLSTDGAFTTEQESLSLADQVTTGSQKAWEIKCTSADTSIGAGQYALISQDIEAQYLQDLFYGTSSAKDITVSFWCKSNLTATFSLFLIKMDSTAYYIPVEFTTSSADTWEKKIITITPTQGSTSLITGSAAVINNDNGNGLQVGIALSGGSNLQGTNNTWSTSANYTTSNQANFLSSTSNNFYLTSFQLEVGSDATEFEVLPHDIQFQRCERYFQVIARVADDTSSDLHYIATGAMYQADQVIGVAHFQTAMRAAPTITISTGSNYYAFSRNNAVDYFDNLIGYGRSPRNCLVYQDSASNISGTAGHGGAMWCNNASASITASSEL